MTTRSIRFGDNIDRAAGHLAALARPTGTFIYKYDAEKLDQLPGYNILRHCGAIWAIHTSVSSGLVDAGLAAAMEPSVAWLLRYRTGRTPTGSMFVCERRSIKLGANGLALLALATSRDTLSVDITEALHALSAYVKEQRREDGDFDHKRRLSDLALINFRSEYYTGEALLGLIAASTRTGDITLLDYAEQCVISLVKRDYGIAAQSHWMMYAVQALHKLRPDNELLFYTRKLSRHIVAHTEYRQRGACTPVACRTEGLLCAAGILLEEALTEDIPLLEQIRMAIETNLALQLKCQSPSGAFRRAPDATEVRIDYIQHALSCLVGYSRLYG